jgi:hypothetical protein
LNELIAARYLSPASFANQNAGLFRKDERKCRTEFAEWGNEAEFYLAAIIIHYQ